MWHRGFRQYDIVMLVWFLKSVFANNHATPKMRLKLKLVKIEPIQISQFEGTQSLAYMIVEAHSMFYILVALFG